MTTPRCFAGQRVTILGLAREGMALARLLIGEGAFVTVSDARSEEALHVEIEELTGWTSDLGSQGAGDGGRQEPSRPQLRFALGGNRAQDVVDSDVVFVSPAVPPQIPALIAARQAGVPLCTLTELFFERCRAPIIGVTGSSGKTTTTTLIGEMLRQGPRPVYVGGNIGTTLIEHVAQVPAEALVVLELSSFQLEGLAASPHVAVVTNITPNHLDRHGTMEAYVEAKSQIVRHQGAGDSLILNADDAYTPYLGPLSPGARLTFSLQGPRPVAAASAGRGAYLDDDRLILAPEGTPRLLCDEQEVGVPGRHNLANALAAASVAAAQGIPQDGIAAVLRAFRGVPHRLELVRAVHEVRWYNDSIATAPERTLAALSVFAREPVVLIAGGRDKHLPWGELARRIVGQCRALVLLGEAAELIFAHVEAALGAAAATGVEGRLTGTGAIDLCHSLDEAVERAARRAHPGDVVLLSPGCTSYDMFKDFEERGVRFRQLVESLP